MAHAASEVPRGGPKLVGRAPDSRFVLGTFLLQGCLWNLLLRRAFAQILEQKFSRNMGATRRLKRNAGEQNLWDISGIRRVSLEPSSSNLVRENFGYENFRAAWAPRGV